MAMRRVTTITWLRGIALAFAVFAAAGAPAFANNTGLGFNNANLAGSCALSFASVDQTSTTAALGLLTFDGAGGLTGTLAANDTSGPSDFKDFTAIGAGTYSVFVDGTGTASFTINGKSKTFDFVIDSYNNAGAFQLYGIDTRANKPGYLKCHTQNAVTAPTALSLIAAPYGILMAEDAGGGISIVAVGRIGFTAVSVNGSVTTGTVAGDLASNSTGSAGFTDFTSFTNGTYTFDSSTNLGSMTFTIPGQPAASTIPFVAYNTFSTLRGLDSASGAAPTVSKPQDSAGGVAGVAIATIQR